ncbi:unnamed protein product [Colias eurytheme]|nr:unnamed protein product [Colias eurytheme]
MKVLMKGWGFLRKYILTLQRFDLFLQGSLLIVIFLESNVYLLLRRNDASGFLPTVNEEWVKIGVGCAEFLLGALVAWQGKSWRNFTLSFWLGATAVCGLIVLAFPFPEAKRPEVDLCGGSTISVYSNVEDPHRTPRGVFLVITAVMCALTRISVWAHGITYLDDHQPENGPYFYGILISIRLSIGMSSSNWLRAASIRDDWWEIHLSLAMLTLMFSILFTLFPRQMPDYKEVDTLERTCILEPLGRVFRNKSLMLQAVALSFLSAAIFGYNSFETYLLQAKFQVETIHEDLRTSRVITDIFRSLVIIFFVTIFRTRFSARRSDGVKATTASRVGGVVTIFVAIVFAVLAGLGCTTDTIEGKGVGRGAYTQPACSQECGCGETTYGFAPVCTLDTMTTYLSPCHAGCQEYEDLNGLLLLHNCTCGVGTQRAVRGSCTLPSCAIIYNIYLVFFTLMLAVGASGLLMQSMSVLRATRRIDKPLAIGVTSAFLGLIANALGHFLYVVINYLTCAYEVNNVCIIHKDSVLAMPAVSSVLCLLSAALSLAASRKSQGKAVVSS